MSGALWAIAEAPAEGATSPRLNSEIATLARRLGEAAGREVLGLLPGPLSSASEDLASCLPEVVVLGDLDPGRERVAQVASCVATLVDREQPGYLLIGATSDGRDLAGMLSALLGWGVLANATEVDWQDGRPVVVVSAFGGRFVTKSSFVGDHGIITVRPNTTTPSTSPSYGTVRGLSAVGGRAVPVVKVVEQIEGIVTTAARIEEARAIVAGGRGLGGPAGFLLAQELADVLGGAVGATRPPVDEGWIPYDQQIGQTGKIVSPELYIGLGISGAIQHRVGIQTAQTIVAIDRDPEVPFSGSADMLVVGDLFEVVPEVIDQIRARRK